MTSTDKDLAASNFVPATKTPIWKRVAVLVLLGTLIGVVLSTGIQDHLSLSALRDNREVLADFVSRNYLTGVTVFIAAYIIIVTLSIPGAVWLSLAGGFVFSVGPATLYIVVAATTGATLVFLLARYVLGNSFRQKAGGAIERMRSGFQKNAFNYMLALRIVPLFPFFLVNIAPAFLNVSLRIYVAGTALGIVPGTFVYAWIGSGLGAALDTGADIDPGSVIYQSYIIGPLLGLGMLALIPVAYRRFWTKTDE